MISRYYTGGYTSDEDSSDHNSMSGTHIFAAVPVICFGFQVRYNN